MGVGRSQAVRAEGQNDGRTRAASPCHRRGYAGRGIEERLGAHEGLRRRFDYRGLVATGEDRRDCSLEIGSHR
jgi:hypothetical protein